MFATLVVQLPVQGGHTGGTLRVTHRGQAFAWDSAADSRSGHLAYAAFYADCEHELTAVTGGLRMTLVYNLVRMAPQESPLPAPRGGRTASLEALGAAVRGWEAAPGAPRMLTIPLEHKYTEANLSFCGLKGRDAAVVTLLAGCEALDVHLALVRKRVRGIPKTDDEWYDSWRAGDWYRSWLDENDEEDEEGEDDSDGDDADAPSDASDTPAMYSVTEEHVDAPKWVPVSGPKIDLRSLAASLDSCLLTGDRLFAKRGGKPDEHELEAYTGNEGPSLDYIYHRAVAVIWPHSRSGAVACAAGFGPATELLEQMMGELQAAQQQQQQQQPRGNPQGHEEVQLVEPEEGEEAQRGQKMAGPQRSDAAQQPEGGEGDGEEAQGRRLVEAQRQAAQLLESVLTMAERSPRETFPMHTFPAGAVATRALRIAAASAKALPGQPGAGAVRRFVVVLARSEGLASPSVVQTLAEAAAAAVADPDLEDAIGELVYCCHARQFKRCLQLVNEPAIPEALRGRIVKTLMEVALGPDFAGMWKSDILLMARLVCEGGPLFQPHQPAFAAAVLARTDKQELLRVLMREPCIACGAAAGAAPVVALVAERLRELQERAARGPPVFSWEMRNARLLVYPQVLDFLRGPEQTKTFKGCFNGIKAARSFAEGFFSGKEPTLGFSGTAVVGGRGKGAHCTITKDTRAFEAEREKYNAMRREIKALQAMAPSLTPASAEKAAAAAGGGKEAAAGGGAEKAKAPRSEGPGAASPAGRPAKAAKQSAGATPGAGLSAAACVGRKVEAVIDLSGAVSD
ncbi:hypothetical protein PLESTB_000410300 [Pleodorina starrii]|uniref:Prolyl 4-hydroxylase alpha subunit Fe(2+) 2OG dioxygenase domain-containing protein n=1 Tax=Pleodorina starrii TaxID=330485 RepID=A0A9W6BFS7_9CHLO|nr:hypothetical protein PLESTB_000410300 [Pleodorina starrii]